MNERIGDFVVLSLMDEQLPPSQVGLGVAWVGASFYKKYGYSRDCFVEIGISIEGRQKTIVRLVRCYSRGRLKSNQIGLQYDDRHYLGIVKGVGDKAVEVHKCTWLRGVIPYLARHPNPLIRYQFWLSTSLAIIGLLVGFVGLL